MELTTFYRYIGAFSLFLYYGGSPWLLDDLNNSIFGDTL